MIARLRIIVTGLIAHYPPGGMTYNRLTCGQKDVEFRRFLGLREAFDYCLTREARECAARAVGMVGATGDEFVAALREK